MTETIDNLVEFVYLPQEKYNEMQLNGTLDENTIYMTDYNGSITDYSELESRIEKTEENVTILLTRIESLELQIEELKSLIIGISNTIDNINGEEI